MNDLRWIARRRTHKQRPTTVLGCVLLSAAVTSIPTTGRRGCGVEFDTVRAARRASGDVLLFWRKICPSLRYLLLIACIFSNESTFDLQESSFEGSIWQKCKATESYRLKALFYEILLTRSMYAVI